MTTLQYIYIGKIFFRQRAGQGSEKHVLIFIVDTLKKNLENLTRYR
jgi:hypothetical protein